ncbi:MAG TPA: LptA/OstA family protein [Methyloceanibacter sp.]|nr:LptA/OstA family protein [Methyloceanibacter sp.]
MTSFSKLLRLTAVLTPLLLACAGGVAAQTLNNSFGGLSESSDEPIDIESDRLVVYDAKKFATFSGSVKAVQGTTTLRARELDVHYVGGAEDLTAKKDGARAASPASNPAPAPAPAVKPAAPAPQAGASAAGKSDDPGSKITKIEARGDVIINSEDDQTTTSEWALYDVPAQMVTVGGNVVLTQGQNVLKGDRLIIDLKTGESRFENTGEVTPGKRIRALFMPKDDGKADEKPGDPDEAVEKRAAQPPATSGRKAGTEQGPAVPGIPGEDPWVLVPDAQN